VLSWTEFLVIAAAHRFRQLKAASAYVRLAHAFSYAESSTEQHQSNSLRCFFSRKILLYDYVDLDMAANMPLNVMA